MYSTLIKYCLSHGGIISPLEIDSDATSHEGICNPSILIDDDKVRLILRNVNYALWSSDNDYKFTSVNGPLYYITKDHDEHLRTKNFLCTINENDIEYKCINTSLCDLVQLYEDDAHVRYYKEKDSYTIEYNEKGEPVYYKEDINVINETNTPKYEPIGNERVVGQTIRPGIWEFIGQEDMRLVKWNGKLYGTGVERDWNTDGIGRMHLSELNPDNGDELTRIRLKAPSDYDHPTYCEKNWMPILDMPYHYVKWCTPTEIVKIDPKTGECETVLIKEQDPTKHQYYNTNGMGIRGSSQVIPWGEYRIAITHMCELWINEKKQKSGSGYCEQFIVWDKDWNIVKMSQPFRFNNFGIEFTNGLAYNKGSFLIPFALQDNISFMLTIGEDVIRNFIWNDNVDKGRFIVGGNDLLDFFNDSTNSYNCMKMGDYYYSNKHYAGAMVCYERASEYNTFDNIDELYKAIFMVGKSIAMMGDRDYQERDIWTRLINLAPYRSEGYIMMSRYYSWRNAMSEAYMFAKLGYEKNFYRDLGRFSDIKDITDGFIEYVNSKYSTERYKECENDIYTHLKMYNVTEEQKNRLGYIIETIEENKKNVYRAL